MLAQQAPTGRHKTMPITKLDAAVALVVIDLQKGIVAIPGAHPVADIINRSAQLARRFRKLGLPVVLVNVDGRPNGRTDAGMPNFSFPPDWTEFVPELEQQPGDITITKQSWGAFIGTPLHDNLRDKGVTQIVIVGVATSIGVESTARSAYDHGYNVAVVVDAMTDRDPDAHRHSIEKIFPRLGETGTTENVLTLLHQAAD
jgi:nicotinamidase-related amidase